MASRASARRNQPSSPPRQSPQSPVTRRMRTRSASLELGGNIASPVAKEGKRTKRQGSVESVESNLSAASSNRGGRRKKATRGAIQYPELSLVEEEKEVEQPDGGEEGEEGEEAEGSGQLPRSPGGMSQMSGTTAITSASAQTSHNTAELAELDATMVVEILPDLWVSSLQILALTPADATVESVESLVRELKVPGSAQGKRLMHREQKFTVDRERFGNDAYIRPSFILQKVFGSQEIESGLLRPDAIIQAGNLAAFIKELLVKQKEGTDAYQFLSNLDTWFPESFVSQFQDDILFGNSNLLEESFDLALEIRTQYTIVALLYQNSGETEWDPIQVLTELFFDPLTENSQDLALFDNAFENGAIKNLLRAGPANTNDQETSVKKRVLEIHNTFRDSEDAAQAGDLVDWDQLEEQFPWSVFQAKAVQWAKSRQDEIIESVRLQGGVETIVKSLVETIKNNDSQAELNFEPHPSTSVPRQLLPPADIVPAISGHNLMNQSNVRLFQSMKQSSSHPPSAQDSSTAATSKVVASSSSKQRTPPPRPQASRLRATEPSEQAGEELAPFEDDNNDLLVPEVMVRSTADYTATWDAHNRDTDKENLRKGKTVKRVDRPQDVQKVRWDNESDREGNEGFAGSSKRTHATMESEHSDDETSQDEGFQTDQRNPDPNLRLAAPSGRGAGPGPGRPPSPKRPRIRDDSQEASAARRRRERDGAKLQASARRGAPEEIDDEAESQAEERRQASDDIDEFEDAPPSTAQVAALARMKTAITKQRTAPTQTRTRWSEHDTELLVDYIGELGCSWSAIEKVADFEDEHNQVALKDKARNLKVVFLKAGLQLPRNFDKVALGQKELRAVRNVLPDYDGNP